MVCEEMSDKMKRFDEGLVRPPGDYLRDKKYGIAFLASISLYIISVIILGKSFEELQLYLFKSPDDILFIYSTNPSSAFMPVGMLIVCFICAMRIISGKRRFTVIRFKISFLSVGLVIFLLTISIEFFNIFTYTKVNDDGFIIKRSILANREAVDWNYVDSARVEYISGIEKIKHKKYYGYSYYILLKNGEEINLKASKDFEQWDKVIFLDKYIENKGVKIIRDRIDGAMLSKLVDEYKMDYEEHTERVIERIFRYGRGYYD